MLEVDVAEALRILREFGVQAWMLRQFRWNKVYYSLSSDLVVIRHDDKEFRFEGRRASKVKRALRALQLWSLPEDKARDPFVTARRGGHLAMPPWMIDRVVLLQNKLRVRDNALDSVGRFALDMMEGGDEIALQAPEAWGRAERILRILSGGARLQADQAAVASYVKWCVAHPIAEPLPGTPEAREAGRGGPRPGAGRPAIGSRPEDPLLLQLQFQWGQALRQRKTRTDRWITREMAVLRKMIDHLLTAEGDGPYSALVVDAAFREAPRRKTTLDSWRAFSRFVIERSGVVLPIPLPVRALPEAEDDDLPPEVGESQSSEIDWNEEDLPPEA